MLAKKKKMWGLMFLLIAVSLLLFGCGDSSSGNETTNNAQSSGSSQSTGGSNGDATADDTQERVDVSMLIRYHTESAPDNESIMMKSIEEYSNANLDITWIPQNVFEEKLNVTMSSGEMPEVLMVTGPLSTSVLNGIKADMFWAIDDYLDEFPNLKKFDPLIMDSLMIDGKSYVLPRPRPISRDGLIIRKDWLEELGLDEPSTIDEFYNMLVAFKERDPDGNGEDDTYGMMLYEDRIPMSIFAWHGAPNNWKVENGKFIKDAETPEYKEALRFVRKLYAENLINHDFPVVVRNEARKDLYNDKVGASIEALDAVIPFYNFNMEDAGANFDLMPGMPLEGKSYATISGIGGAVIPKTSVKTEDDLRKVLRYFDTQMSDEATEKFKKLIDENEEKPANEQFNIDDLKSIIVNDVAMYPPGDSEINRMIKSRMEEHAAVSIPDPSLGLISPTLVEKGEQLNIILSDARTQFVLGRIDESGLDAALELWKSSGGNQVAEELAELYQQIN